MRYRIVRVVTDDGAFGYTAPPTEEVIHDYLTRAQAKVIWKHYCEKYPWNYLERVSFEIEVLTDEGWWENISQAWILRAAVEQEDDFEEKGLDFYWWLQFGKIRKIG